MQERGISTPVRKSRFLREDDELLFRLKGDDVLWDKILGYFLESSKGKLQVRPTAKSSIA